MMQDTSLSVDLVTLQRDDVFDISRILARALDPELLNVSGKPVIFSVTGAPGSGKKIISDATFEEARGDVDMLFSGRKGYDEFFLDPSDKGLQLSFIDMGWGFGYETESLKKPGVTSSGALLDAFMKVSSRHGGIAVLQNPRQDVPGIHVFIENGLSDPNTNPRNIPVLEKRPDGAVLFSAARAALADRSWVRQIKIEITDEQLAHNPRLQAAIAALNKGAERVRRALLEEKRKGADLPLRPYQGPAAKLRR